MTLKPCIFAKLVCVCALITGAARARAELPSRPNAPLNRAGVQASALPTTKAAPRGQLGGASSGAQKSVGTLGGPSAAATAVATKDSAPAKASHVSTIGVQNTGAQNTGALKEAK